MMLESRQILRDEISVLTIGTLSLSRRLESVPLDFLPDSLWIPRRSDCPPEKGSWRQLVSHSKEGVRVITGTGVPVGDVSGVDCHLGVRTQRLELVPPPG